MHVFHDVQSLSWTFQLDPSDGLILCELKNFVETDVLLWNYGTEVHSLIAYFLFVCNLITLHYFWITSVLNTCKITMKDNKFYLMLITSGFYIHWSWAAFQVIVTLHFKGKYCNFTCYFADYILLQSKSIFLYKWISSATEWKTFKHIHLIFYTTGIFIGWNVILIPQYN